MKASFLVRIVVAGLLGGLLCNTFLGLAFTSPMIRGILYNPEIQSSLFIEVTAARNVPVSVMGLIVLSVIHAWLFVLFRPALPGYSWQTQGAFWGLCIWLMYWVFQEWFIYFTLLHEPLALVALELFLLLIGSLLEGVAIAFLFRSSTYSHAH